MTAPYYQDDLITLYNGDCLEIRDWLAADVLITDPPYGTEGGNGYGRARRLEDGSYSGLKIANDADTGFRDRVLELWGDRPAAVFGSPRLTDPPMNIVDRLVWDKTRPGTNGGPWRYQHESIYATAGFHRVSNSAFSVLRAFPDQRWHIHGKPVAVMAALVEAAPPGVIADPFAGSLTTLVACRQLGRPCIAVELEEQYCELVATRLAQEGLAIGGDGPSFAQQAFDLPEPVEEPTR